jgi:ethanolamine transporter EutH
MAKNWKFITLSLFLVFILSIIKNLNLKMKKITQLFLFLLLAYPLSITTLLSLKMTNLTPFDGTIKIFDVAEKLMQSEKRLFKSGELIEEINVNKLDNGLFILMIETGKGTINKRFIIQN